MAYARVGRLIHPIYSVLHRKVALLAQEHEPCSLVDIGGKGRMRDYVDCQVKNANITEGYDGANLHQFSDEQFGVSTSIAVLEHVPVERRDAFLAESLRVARFAAIHWVPAGEMAERTEAFKNGLKLRRYRHKCVVMPWRPDMEPFLTVGEYLLLLATIYPGMNTLKVHDFVCRYGGEPYGAILHLKH